MPFLPVETQEIPSLPHGAIFDPEQPGAPANARSADSEVSVPAIVDATGRPVVASGLQLWGVRRTSSPILPANIPARLATLSSIASARQSDDNSETWYKFITLKGIYLLSSILLLNSLVATQENRSDQKWVAITGFAFLINALAINIFSCGNCIDAKQNKIALNINDAAALIYGISLVIFSSTAAVVNTRYFNLGIATGVIWTLHNTLRLMYRYSQEKDQIVQIDLPVQRPQQGPGLV